MARKKAGEQTYPQAAAQDAQVPKEASQDEKSQKTQAQETVAGEAKTGTQPAAAPPAAPAPVPGEAPAPRLALRITAKPRKGFRRCGRHHPAAAVDHPEGRFSETEIALLKAEPNLVVEDL